MPWLKRGGAELEAIRFINLVAANRTHRVLLVVTDLAECPWKSRLHESVLLFDIATLFQNLKWKERLRLLLNLLVQLRPHVIHLIYSFVGSEVFVSHGRTLSFNTQLFSSMFNCEQDSAGQPAGFPVNQLPRYAPYVRGIVSDNRVFLAFLEETYGLDAGKLFLHYQPVEMLPLVATRPLQPEAPFRVLWAGRLAPQKRPDLLLQIAERCRNEKIQFHVYGNACSSGDSLRADFKNSANITYHGPFDGLHSLDAEQFDLFLLTSQFEGMPNILLEAASASLPIVSSNVGGVHEFIEDGVNGILVSPFDDVERYVAAIKQLMNDTELRKRFVTNGRAVLIRQHSQEEFVAGVARLPGYLLNSQHDALMNSSRLST
jgi:glycosyltransferase involved in cell wall biosynthesis